MLILVFLFGAAARLYDLNDAPLDFHPTRQLHSMLIARGMYYQNLDDAPEWKRKFAVAQWKGEGELEPPIMERLSVLGYQLVGYEDLRIPRILSIFFWTIGGIGLFLLLRDIVGGKGAVIGVAYYMLLPYMIIASRSFQPEPLMTAAVIWSWWGVNRWVKQPTWKNTLLAGLLSGLALFIKLPAIFFIAPVILGAVFLNRKIKAVATNPQIWTMALLTILPTFLFYMGDLFSGFLKHQSQLRFFPNLWLDPVTYLRWKISIDKTLKTELFLAGLFGALLIKDKKRRIMFSGVFIGYFLYGLYFSYHIMTHDYYQVPMTPAVAIGLAAAASVLIEHIRGRKLVSYILLAGILSFWIVFNFYSAIDELKDTDYTEVPSLYESLSEKVGNYSVISMTPDYGYRMIYWGWKSTRHWLSEGDFYLRELAGMEVDQLEAFMDTIDDAELFLVTDFSEFDQQSDVKEILTDNYPIFDQGDKYIIYDLSADQ